MDRLASQMNPPQLAAVRHEQGPLLILAGAGSGKTRVLTHRIAHLLDRGLARPGEILAVTFTNKAAGELKERVSRLVGPVAERLWVSTFHAFGARVLRREAQALGLDRSFAIYDDTDQLAACKRACEACDVEAAQAKSILHRIDRWKNEGLLPAQVKAPDYDLPAKVAAKVYARYQQELQQSQALDFGDLIVRVTELFTRFPNIGDQYASRFRFLLVDEFQDTNPAQYQLLKRLEAGHGNLCVVGDDDQSIYRWRGAEVSNILDFPKDHPGCAVVKLEQNYRSSGNILTAAHAVIAKNPRRAEKKLWTAESAGEPLRVVLADDERDEASKIAAEAYAENARGTSYSEMAIFYRQNAQSRALEDALRAHKVPYRVVRGRSFYDRVEVKDVAAYLRLSVNPRSDGDLLRIINQPPRGIGDTTVDRLRQSAARRGFSLWEALQQLEHDPELAASAKTKLLPLRKLLNHLIEQARVDPSAAGAIDRVLDETGLEERYLDEGEEGAERVENVRELLGAARDFDALWAEAREAAARQPREDLPPLPAGTAALLSAQMPDEAAEEESDAVAPEASGADADADSLTTFADSASTPPARTAPEALSFDFGDLAPAPAKKPAARKKDAPPPPPAPRLTAPRAESPRTAQAPGALGSATAADDWLEGAGIGERPSLRAGLAAASPDFEARPRGPRDADERDTADTPLLGFLEQLALVGDADAESDGERVGMMTLHAAKGLEFDAVWMTGMEERVFPGSRALGLSGPNATGEADPDELAEERRLCYVGMTRARKRLTLTLARCRSLFGELKFNEASRFLRELPPQLATGLRAIEGLNEGMSAGGGFGRGFGGGGRGRFDQGGRGGQAFDEFDQRSAADDAPASPFGRRPPAPAPKMGPQASKAPALPAAPGSAGKGTATVEGFAKGMRVRHAAFGIGSVEELDGGGQGLKLSVRFQPGVGLKKVLARFVERF